MSTLQHTIKGFTLLETLASIAILSLVIVGPLAVLSSSSAYARQTKDIVTATYLAEGAIELLQNQYDSLYVYCKRFPNATDIGEYCEPQGTETIGETTWRLFKQRFGAATVSGINFPSCYRKDEDRILDENPDGCAFDFPMILGTTTDTHFPDRYVTNDDECPFLRETSAITNVTGRTEGVYTYRCTGILPTTYGGLFGTKQFYKRSVLIEQMPTFESGAGHDKRYEQYADDLRITSSISFSGVNGVTQTINVVRFMHARL